MTNQYLLVTDKWDTYALRNNKGVEYAALALLKERAEQGFWYFKQDAEQAREILANDDAKRALQFLLNRRGAEYEYVEVKHEPQL